MLVVVLHDPVPEGAPPDQQDNLVQAREMGECLANLGHQAKLLALDERPEVTARALAKLAPQAVFNLVESPLGQGRLIHLAPLLLERLGLPFTGAGTKAMLLSSHKIKAKEQLRRAGLPTPDWLALTGEERGRLAAGRYLVKSIWEHGSVGLDEGSLLDVTGPDDLREALARRQEKVGGEWFAERFIEGREFNIALLASPRGPEILPPAEILFMDYPPDKPRLVDYRAKWAADSFEYTHTPRKYDFSPADWSLLGELKALSLRCWRIFNLKGWARVDFRVDKEMRPWILEVNANPCLSADAGFMAAANRSGLDQTRVVERILADAAGPRPQDRPRPMEMAHA